MGVAAKTPAVNVALAMAMSLRKAQLTTGPLTEDVGAAVAKAIALVDPANLTTS